MTSTTMTKLARLFFAGLAALSLTSLSSPARAVPSLRDEMRNQTMGPFDAAKQTNYLPCSVCHEHSNTGIGSVRTPFGISIRAHGIDLDAADDDVQRSDNVFNVIHAMDLEGTDSDGDGVPDMEELRKKTDPNTYGAVRFIDETEPRAGCQCGVAGRASSSGAWWMLGGALGALAITSRRATRRGRPSRA